jgi:cytochrome bd-type quinol oxidase subunit 1
MTPQTEENINEALNWLQETGSTMQDFAVEQTPLYCQEVVAWAFWQNAIGAGTGLALLAVGIFCAYHFYKQILLPKPVDEILIPSMIVGIICFVAGFLSTAIHLPDAVKAVVSPRLVIVEHLMNLRK